MEAEIGRLLIVCEAIQPGGRHLLNLVFAGRATRGGAGAEAVEAATGLDPAVREVRWVTPAELQGLELRPPIAGAVGAAWAAGFGGDVQVLGNVWMDDPSQAAHRGDPGRL